MKQSGWILLWAATGLASLASSQTIVLENATARMTWELAGGGLVGFELKEQPLNPFTWEEKSTQAARFRGHFLCLDRWGAPSAAERAAGMPFHGEASRIVWRSIGSTATEAEMAVQLKLARLAVTRRVVLDGNSALVTESVTNEASLGRVYNMVQHPTIGPPFLNESVLVDANARQGFMQSSPLPNPENPAVVWPQALNDGMPVSLRTLTGDANPNVVSYVIDDEWGWVTALHPAKGLLLGYVWRTAAYPWLNIWRHIEGGKPFARGLEFGTTGLHQPFSVLVGKGRIFGRPLFTFLDTTETATRSYQVFYTRAPAAFAGANSIRRNGAEWVVTGRNGTEIRVKALLD